MTLPTQGSGPHPATWPGAGQGGGEGPSDWRADPHHMAGWAASGAREAHVGVGVGEGGGVEGTRGLSNRSLREEAGMEWISPGVPPGAAHPQAPHGSGQHMEALFSWGLRSEEGGSGGSFPNRGDPQPLPRPSRLQTSEGRPEPKFSGSALRLHRPLSRNRLAQEGAGAWGNHQ